VILLRASAALAVVGVLVGCSAPATPEPDPTATVAKECAQAAAQIVTAVEEVVSGYDEPTDRADAPSAGDGAGGDDALADAVTSARETRDRLGCEPDAFTAWLQDGLSSIKPEGAIASAVLGRLTASILGTARQDAGEWVLAEGDDLVDALARAAEGTTLVLPAGTVDVDQTVVLLQGVTLRGAGRDATTIRSSAADAALLVVTAGLIRLEDLTVELTGTQPASGLIAGPSASVAMTGVRIVGGTATGDGVGGAGVYLSAEGDEASGRGTTLEITDSLFERNAWAGVAVAGGHRVSIESSSFAGNGEAGILFLDTASGSVGGSSFTDNKVGVAATGSATPTLLGSTVSGGSVGVQVDASAAPVISGVQISGSSSAAVIFGGASAGSITATTCENVPYGIVIANTSAPTIGENGCPLARGPS
jgi:hypothetical protein